MNIDQRLERLTERHEALTQSLELLASGLTNLKTYVGEIAEGTARLLHIAQIHENRITRLEDKGT